MRASVLVPSSDEKEKSGRPSKKRRSGPRLRVVTWNAASPSEESVRVIWEGTDPDGPEGYHGTNGLPQLSLLAGNITEFQELISWRWQPCCDPRAEHLALVPRNRHTQIVVIDSDRAVWDKHWNFFESARTTFIIARNVDDAEQCFVTMPLGPRDSLIVNYSGGDVRLLEMIRTLRTRGFNGQIYGLAEKPRWGTKLVAAGCTKTFSKKDVWKLIRAIHQAQNA